MELTITISKARARVPVTVLHLVGELDGSNYEQLIDTAREICGTGARNLVLDLSRISYLSSSGLVALHAIAMLLRDGVVPDLEHGWQAIRAIDRERDNGYQACFKLSGPQPRIDRVLDTVGFKRYLQVFPDVAAAVASF